ncbi:MAG TPA: carboxypeptidase-like regulatory domain-containing protein [Thermoanaerobaculia bacterium]|nr:carboxypeptidase-like regulatory domain-containing protein [Thermoanaerobaculia bacterium]
MARRIRARIARVMRPIALLAALLITTQTVQAAPGRGRIAGKVVDRDGKPLASVVVRLLAAGLELELTTAADGRFVIPALPPGPSLVIAESATRGSVIRPNVEVFVERTTEIVIVLDREPDQTVTIVRATPLLDRHSFALGTIFAPIELLHLPSDGTIGSFLRRGSAVGIATHTDPPRAVVSSKQSTASSWLVEGVPLSSRLDSSALLPLSAGSLATAGVSTSSMPAYAASGGARINVLPRKPSATLSGSASAHYNESLSSGSIDDVQEVRFDLGSLQLEERLSLWGAHGDRRAEGEGGRRVDDSIARFSATGGGRHTAQLLLVRLRDRESQKTSLAGFTLSSAPSAHTFARITLSRTEERALNDSSRANSERGAIDIARSLLGRYQHVIEGGVEGERSSARLETVERDDDTGSESIWISDSISSDRWTVEAGLRFERSGRDDSGSTQTTSSILPRLGASFLIPGERRSVFRAHLARYQEPLTLPAPASGSDRPVETAADLDPAGVDEIVVGYEREILPEMTVGLAFTHRRLFDRVTIGTTAEGHPRIENRDRSASAKIAELFATKRLSNGFLLRGHGAWVDAPEQQDHGTVACELLVTPPPATCVDRARWSYDLAALAQLPRQFLASVSIAGRDRDVTGHGDRRNLFALDARLARLVGRGEATAVFSVELRDITNGRSNEGGRSVRAGIGVTF